jgi:hypothetical protein
MAKIVNTFATLPQELIEDFEKIQFTKIERNYALKFIDNLMRRSFREYKMIDEFVETPKNYFRKVFNSQYSIWLEKLICSKIIISNNSYSNINNNIYSKSYSINTKYTLSTIMWLTFEESALKSIPYTFKIEEETGQEKIDFKRVVEDLNHIKIDKKQLYKVAYDEVEKIKIENFKTDDEVTRDTFTISFGKRKKYWMSKEKAIEKSEKLNKTLIQDGNKFYILDKNDFITRKKQSVLQSYQDAINKLANKKFYGKRNSTNNRLDTNLTNMAKSLTKWICTENNLIQFDLCNSQFAILSDLLEKELSSEDFDMFKEQSYNGTLYEYIMENLNLNSRVEAKKMMFELMFSKEDYKSHLKTKLKKVFPSVVKAVDDYKKENGYNNFSIMLQKRESEIFIDGLWKQVKNKKMFCTPKHDCLIVKEKDAEKIEQIINSYFNKINFKGKIIKE